MGCEGKTGEGGGKESRPSCPANYRAALTSQLGAARVIETRSCFVSSSSLFFIYLTLSLARALLQQQAQRVAL